MYTLTGNPRFLINANTFLLGKSSILTKLSYSRFQTENITLTALNQNVNGREILGWILHQAVHLFPFSIHMSLYDAHLVPRLSWYMPPSSLTSPSCGVRRTSLRSFFSIATTTNASSASTSAHHSTSSTSMTCRTRLSREFSRIRGRRRSY